jgi:hypothetical protein
MKNYNSEIRHLILEYLAGKANPNQQKLVQDLIQHDPGLGGLLVEYKDTIEVLRRKWIKEDWAQTNRKFAMRRMFFYGTSIILFLGFFLLFFLSKPLIKSIVHSKSFTNNQQKTIQLKSNTRYKIINLKTAKSFTDTNNKKSEITALFAAPSADSANPIVVQMLPFNKKPLFDDAKVQYFLLNPLRDTTIWCNEGLGIKITAHSLQTLHGENAQSPVLFYVKEYLTYAEMFKGRMTTTAGTHLLETGGSCYIEATQNGEALKLIPGQNITLFFPNHSKRRNANLYWKKGQHGICKLDSCEQIGCTSYWRSKEYPRYFTRTIYSPTSF